MGRQTSRRFLLAGFSLSSLLVLSGTAAAETLTVQQDGSGDYTSIQAAIEASGQGDVIEVGPGVYHETLFYGGRHIEVRSTHGPEATVIDGSQFARSIVLINFFEGRSAKLSGFTLRNGLGSALESPQPDPAAQLDEHPLAGDSRVERLRGAGRFGGAILCNPSDATLENLIIEGNLANVGGGITAINCDPLIRNVRFVNNVAGEGAAIAALQSNPQIIDCEFQENSGVLGTVYGRDSGLQCRQSRFERNSAGEGGGLYIVNSPTAIVENSVFWLNLAADGAAVRARSTHLELSRNVFADNYAPGWPASQVHYTGASGPLHHNVWFAGPVSEDVDPLRCEDGSTSLLRCNFFWPSEVPEACFVQETNLRIAPGFCNATQGNFSLQPDSPCLSSNSPNGCGQVGPTDVAGCAIPYTDAKKRGEEAEPVGHDGSGRTASGSGTQVQGIETSGSKVRESAVEKLREVAKEP